MSSEVWKGNKAQTTHQDVKIIQQSGLHLQCAHMYCFDRPARQHCVCVLPTCPIAHAFDIWVFICISACHAMWITAHNVSKLCVMLQKHYWHPRSVNTLERHERQTMLLVPVITAMNMFGFQQKPHLIYTEIRAKTHTHTHTCLYIISWWWLLLT